MRSTAAAGTSDSYQKTARCGGRMIFVKMTSAAGVKRAELQGASSVVHEDAMTEAMQGKT
jgi:hypothetical protein